MKRPPVGAFMLTVFFLSACDSAKLKQFSSLAAAGSAYTATFPAFSNQLGAAMITINNDQAVRAHANPIDLQTAKSYLLQQNADLKAYLKTLDRLNAQVQVLGAYFDAMGALANSKASDPIVDSANALVDQLKGVNDALGKSKLNGLPGSRSIDELTGPAIGLVVAHFEVKALDQNLQANADVVDRALALQDTAVKAMTAQLSPALQGDDKLREQTQVVDPYLLHELPKGWAADRTAYLRSSATLDNADAAQMAITNLRAAFRDVVTKKDSQVDFSGLLDAIGGMAGYSNSVRAALASAN